MPTGNRVLPLVIVLSVLPLIRAQTAQTITITAVTNSADFQPGLPQKGSLASIFTTGLESTQLGVLTPPPVYPLSNSLAGMSVWINSLPAPILGIAFLNGYQQINVQVPWEGQRQPLYVEVIQNGIRGHTEDTQAVGIDQLMYDVTGATGMSVFFADANGYGVVQHATDYSPVTPKNPAHAGEYLIAYGINLGPVGVTQASGTPAPGDPPQISVRPNEVGVCSMVDVLHLGPAKIFPSFVGLAPGTIGVYQINFQVPLTAGSGDLALTLERDFTVYPFGNCPGGRSGPLKVMKTSRPVTLPVR